MLVWTICTVLGPLHPGIYPQGIHYHLSEPNCLIFLTIVRMLLTKIENNYTALFGHYQRHRDDHSSHQG